jgi:NAD(P)H-dependent flavin oxidoreductase YrpB (nitropropane dioxygenase family)
MSLKRLSGIKISGFKMPRVKMPQLKIGNSVARVPIVQGGMGVGISLAGLASAVANEGASGSLPPMPSACWNPITIPTAKRRINGRFENK